MEPAYHDAMRTLQDRFDTRRLADRLDERLARAAFTAEDRQFVESRQFFFLASADTQGRPDCSFKGGAAGFVRVVGEDELAFPSYDGNGMFRSLGNVLVNPAVALLFIDFDTPRSRSQARRHGGVLRVHRADGCATQGFLALPRSFPSWFQRWGEIVGTGTRSKGITGPRMLAPS